MGSRGDAYDNAVAESFFATLKKELIHRRSWPTRRELGSAVFEYIEAFYNRDRRHSTLGMHSPAEYEKLLYAAKNQETDRQRPSSQEVSSEAGEVHRARRGRATTCGFFDPALRKASVSPTGVYATATVHSESGNHCSARRLLVAFLWAKMVSVNKNSPGFSTSGRG